MPPHELVRGVFNVGAIDWDRRLFDDLIPLPDGTSYNSYVVVGSERTALIDAVDPTKIEELFAHLDETGVERIDYVICNHAEQDHSGGIVDVLERYPDAIVVTNAKCMGLCMDHLHIPEDRFKVVADGDTLSLGDRTLEFMLAPWVHWPETMFAYLREEGILFTCDFLGSHLATSDVFASDWDAVYPASKRYYAEIMMPFKHLIPKYLDRIAGMDVKYVCPSHGPIHDEPSRILEAYADWTSPDVKNEAVVAYVSMHGSTRRMAEHLVEALASRGVKAKAYNLTVTDIGDLAMELVDAATVVIATPTVLTGAHPAAVYAAYLTNALKPKTRFLGLIGSYGWGTKVVDQVTSLLGNMKAEFLEPVLVKGLPRDEDYKALDGLAETIAQRHKDQNIM